MTDYNSIIGGFASGVNNPNAPGAQANAPTGFLSTSEPVAKWADMKLADTAQAEQFFSEEWNAAFARGGAHAKDPFAGWSLPPGEAGDFWTLYSEVENYAANTGWRNLASPQMLTQLLAQGASSWDSFTLFSYLGSYHGFGNAQAQPWGLVGMNHTDFNKYKIQNQDQLSQQFGQKYTDSNVVQSMRNPLTTFHAQGSAFGQEAPFVSAQPPQNLGHQSSVR